MQCPQCEKGQMFRSKRTMFERLLYSRLGFYPWRCCACGNRKLSRAREESQSKPSPLWMG